MEVLKRCLALVLASAIALSAGPALQARTFSYGLEWGACAQFLNIHHYNFIDNAGGRVDERETAFTYHANGSVMGKVGVNFSPNFRLDLNGGYAGISDGRRVFPISLRANIMPKGSSSDGFVYFADGGIFFDENFSDTPGILAAAGFGYRLSLGSHSAVNLLLNTRWSHDHPQVANPDGGFVASANVRRSNAEYISLGLTISLDF